MSLGDVVNRHNRAFIWVPNQLPYLVSNPDKLSITCPFKFRQYASHLGQNVPIFTDQVRIGPSSLERAAANIAFTPAPVHPPGQGGGEEAASVPLGPPPDPALDELESHPLLLVEEGGDLRMRLPRYPSGAYLRGRL